MTEAVITHSKIIVINEVGQNTYGDLTFTDKEGTAYKVSIKRKQYFEKVIIQGMTVQLNYAMSSFGMEYIYSAVQIKDNIPAPTDPSKMATVIPKEKPNLPEPAPQAIGMTTKEIGDMIRAGELKEIFGLETAIELIKWYRSQILGTTRIAFDGSKLPQFNVKGKEE